MHFNYKARTTSGAVTEGVIDASDRFAAARQLRAQNVMPFDVTEVVTVKNKKSAQLLDMIVSRVTTREKIVFINNLAGMLSAGLTLYRALEVEHNQIKNSFFKKMVHGIMESINKGDTLSDALAQYPGTFSPLFVSMIHAGEESGNLSKTLHEIGDNLEKSHAMTTKVKGALTYPIVIFFTIILVAILMLMFVVPTLTRIFADLGTTLPLSTRFIIGVSNFMAHNSLLFLGSVALFGGVVYAFVRSSKTRRFRDMVVLRLPIVSMIVKEVHVARTARTLSSLLLSGIEMTRALNVTQDVLQNVYYKEVLAKAEAAVQRGETLSSVFKAELDLYPVVVGEMIAVGEETGAISQMFNDIAHFYEEDIDQKTKNLATIIEPVVMLLIGVAVGFFAISMISPMYNLLSTVSHK